MKSLKYFGVALMVAVACVHGAEASEPQEREIWSAFVKAVGEGRLDAASLELDRLREANAPASSINQAERIIAGRAADAQRLVKLSEDALGQADLGVALRRLELAAQFDRSTLDLPVSSRARAVRAELDSARAALDDCRRKRATACMRSALSRLRQLDRPNADAMLAELTTEDWYAGPSGRLKRVDTPPLGK